MDFNDKLKEYSALIEEKLNYYMDCIKERSVVSQAMKYSLMNGGKRIRPLLVLAFRDAVDPNNEYSSAESALPYACAVEMIHSYSLIHDDLPCMDNDDYRRGKPSCHKAYGEEYALLAGDGLLNLSNEVIFGKYDNLNVETSFKVGRILSDASGIDGMIGGQALDLLSEGKKIELEELKKLHSLKTGAMIVAACKIGATVGGGNENQINSAKQYGKNIGICFQIVDDILDTTSTLEKLGKPIGSDDDNDKSTYVSLLGIEEAEKQADEYTLNALSQIEKIGENNWFLKELAAKLSKRDK